jgi:hypothetical protein
MSINGNYAGNVVLPIAQTLTNTSTTLIDTGIPDKTFTLAGFVICNATGSAVITDLYWWSSFTTIESLVWRKSVPANDTVIISDMPLRLLPGDEIRVKGAADVRVTLIYIQAFPLTGGQIA